MNNTSVYINKPALPVDFTVSESLVKTGDLGDWQLCIWAGIVSATVAIVILVCMLFGIKRRRHLFCAILIIAGMLSIPAGADAMTEEDLLIDISVTEKVEAVRSENTEILDTSSLTIKNNQNSEIYVENISANAVGEWEIVSYNTNFAHMGINEKKFGMTVDGRDLKSGCKLATLVSERNSVTYEIEVKVGPQSTPIEDEQFAEIITTVTGEEPYTTKYAVCLYGINHDVDDEGNLLGMTFGPALGADYRSSYKAHATDKSCLHNLTWTEIANQSQIDPTVFQDCLDFGCTHEVKVNINAAMIGTDYSGQLDDGDGVGTFNLCLTNEYKRWMRSGANSYNNAKVRNTLTGTDEVPWYENPIEETESIFYGFSKELRELIKPKLVKSDYMHEDYSDENNKMVYTSETETKYDKLWLFSTVEIFGTFRDGYISAEGTQYERMKKIGANANELNENLILYNEKNSELNWWTRSSGSHSEKRAYNDTIRTNVGSCGVYRNGVSVEYHANDVTYFGISPGFCLAGPGEKAPEEVVYTIEYDANGGVDQPSTRNKYPGVNILLSRYTPTKEGYVFKEWNTQKDGSGISYASRDYYCDDQSLFLYAQWTVAEEDTT